MTRRQAILETLLIFALFCLHGAWPVPDVNEPYYLGKAIHYWNPQWASSDWFLQTADTHAVFYFSVGWLALILSPTAFAWSVRLLTWALLAWSWQRLSRAVVPKPWASVLTATLLVFLLQHYNLAGEWVVGGAEAKGFSYVAVFLALEALAEGYWNRMWLLLGLASAFHILVGGWAALAAGSVWMGRSWTLRTWCETTSVGWTSEPVWLQGTDSEVHLTNREIISHQVLSAGGLPPASGGAKRLFRFPAGASCLVAPLAALILALPGLVPPLVMNHGVDPAILRQACQIYVFERFPHHLDPASILAAGLVLPFLWIVGLWLLLGPSVSGSPGTAHLWRFAAVAVVIALMGTAISLLTLYDRALAAGWMRFYWYRLVDVAAPLGVALLSVRWFVERKMRVALAFVIGVAAFHAVDCVVFKLFADPPFADRQIDGVAWRSAWLWCDRPAGAAALSPATAGGQAAELQRLGRCLSLGIGPEHTPPDARFLIPHAALTFKWYAGRGEVVNWKETPQDAASLVAWWQRIQDIYAIPNPQPMESVYTSLADAGAPRLKELSKKYEAGYLVTQVSVPVCR